jgi:hypothetical protein
MARQQDGCWRCGARWASELVPPTTLRAIAGGHVAEPARPAAHVADGRWIDEGGSAGSEPAGPLPAIAAAA